MRTGPVPHLSNIVELALMPKAWVSQPQWCEIKRAGPALTGSSTWDPHTSTGQQSGASFGGMGAGELAPQNESRKADPALAALDGLARAVLESLSWW